MEVPWLVLALRCLQFSAICPLGASSAFVFLPCLYTLTGSVTCVLAPVCVTVCAQPCGEATPCMVSVES